MDPSTLMAIASILGPVIAQRFGAGGGQEGRWESTFSPQQRGAQGDILNMARGQSGAADITQNQGYQGGMDWLNNLFNDQNFFDKFEAPLQRQFQEETVPGLANRFAGMGSGGSFGTGFRNQLAREGSNLSTNIAALRGGMQQQGVNQALQYAQQPFSNMLNLYNTGLSQGMNNIYRPATAGFMNQILASLSGGAAQGLGQRWGQGMGQGMGGLPTSTQPGY